MLYRSVSLLSSGPRLFLETICLGLSSPFWCSLLSLLAGRLGWVRIPPHCLWFCLALLSSPLKLVSSHIVLTGRLSTRSHQYFARIRANGRSCNCFAHGHRQSGFHRINQGTFLFSLDAQINSCLLLALVSEQKWHSDQHVQSIGACRVIKGRCVPVPEANTGSVPCNYSTWLGTLSPTHLTLSWVQTQVCKTQPLFWFPSAVSDVSELTIRTLRINPCSS